jgi:hypothetical protein
MTHHHLQPQAQLWTSRKEEMKSLVPVSRIEWFV